MNNKPTNNNLRQAVLTLIAVLTTCATVWAQDLSDLFEYSELPTVTGGQSSNWSSTENYQMLVDGNTATKYGLSSNDPWVEFHYAQPFTPVGYALWTANDEEGRRNPTSWTIKAKNADDSDWTTLVSVDNSSNDKLPMANNTETRFALQNSTAYQYFRFEATRRYNGGEYQFQLAELRFLVVNEQPNEQTLTVYSGSDKSVHAPMKVYFFSKYTNAQSVYPASALGDMAGGTITAIKFYTDSEDIPYTTEATFNIYLTEVASTTISSFVTSGLSTVYTGTGSFEEEGYGGSITITLDTPYQYNGGNLLVGCQNTTLSSGFWRIYFYGQAVAGASISSFVYSAGDTFYPSAINFLAKATFTYTPDTHPYIALTPSSTTVFTGFTQTLTANYGNVSGTPTITYTTSDASVATVSGSGATATVTGVAPGTATITATINDTYTATCAITVEDLHYCTPYFYENTTCIMSFRLGGIWNSHSNFSSGGYGDFTSMSTTLEAGSTASATLGVFWTSYRYDAVAIWIDFNDDFIFDSSTERVGTGLFYGQSSFQSGSIDLSIPRTATRGSHRMRVVLQNNIYPTEIDPCVIGIYGECEDYMVEIVSPCKKPTGLVASDVTSYGATLDWTENGDATAWNIDVNGIVAQNVTTKPYPLTNLSPETSYIVKVAPVCEDEVWSDPITFTTSCPPYDGSITVSNITAYEATVNWTAVEGETYQFALAMTSMGAPGAYNNVTEMPVNLGNLQAQTDYTFYLRKDCGNGYFSDPVTVTFRTACEVVTSFPWSEDFESTPTGSPNIPECWERIASYGTNPIHPYVSNSRPHGGHNCLYMYSFGGPDTNIIALSEMNGIHTKEILFWARDGAGIPGMFEVGYVKNGNFTTLEQVTLTTSYQEFIIPLNNAPADAERIALSSSNSVIVYVDDIIVRDLMPTHIVASNPSEGQMTWEEFAQIVNGGYTYEGKTVYLDEDITTSTMVGGYNANPFMGTFDGQGHTVTFNKGTSSSRFNEEYCAPFRFAQGATFQNLKVTGAIYTSMQWAAGFVARVQYGGVSFINCESNILINSTKDGLARHGGFLANFNRSVASFEGCAFTGQFFSYNSTDWGGFVGQFSVGEGTMELTNCVFAPNPLNALSNGGFTFARPSSESDEVTTNNCYYTDRLGTAQGKRRRTVTCQSPATMAMVGTATEYGVSHITAYSGNPGLLYNGTVIAGVGDQVNLNLSGGAYFNTDYGAISGSVNPYTLNMADFNTTITAIPGAPYSTDFETGCDWTLANGSCTNAWTWGTAANIGLTSQNRYSLYISNDGGANNAYTVSGSSMVYAYKTFYLEAGMHCFSYQWRANGESTYDYLRVALVPASVSLEAATYAPYGFSTATLPEGWIALDNGSKLNLSTDWMDIYSYIMVSAAGSYKMVFAWRNDGSQGNNPPAAIDNVSIEATSCPPPSNLTVGTVSAATANLSWTAWPEVETYTVRYKKTSESAWQTVSVPGGTDQGSATLTGLIPETEYHASVYAECNPSITTMLAYFTTTEACPVPTNLVVDHVSATMADLSWTAEPLVETYTVKYKETWESESAWQTVSVAGGTEQGSVTLTGLRSGTNYHACVYAECNPNTTTALTYFRTTESCPVPTNLAVGHVGATTAHLSWTAEPEVDNYIVVYRTAEQFSVIFHEGFDNESDNWTLVNCNEYTFIVPNSSVSYQGTGSFQFFRDSNPPQYLISPELTDINEDMTLEFYYKNDLYGFPETFQVGVSSTDNATGSFTFGAEITASDTQWHRYSEMIPAGTKYICWKCNSNDKMNLYLDEIAVKKSIAPAGAWQSTTVLGNAFEVSMTLTDLTPETEYEAYVYPDCNPDKASDMVSFTTTEACPAPTNLAVGLVSATTATINWTAEPLVDSYTVNYRTAENIFVAFHEGFENGLGNWTMVDCEISTGITTEAYHSGSSAFGFSWSINPPQYLISPELTGIDEDMTLEFYYKNRSTNYPETFQVGTSSTNNATGSFSFGSEITTSDTQWHLYSATIPAGTKHISVKLNSYDALALYIDEISVKKSIAPAGAWQSTIVQRYTTEVSATLTGLIPETEYDVCVYPDCNPDNVSETVSFTTAAGGILTKEINGYGTGNGNWYLIASPLATDVNPTDVTNMLSNEYDLYRFNQSEELEWRNHKDQSFDLENGKGYLYANSEDVTLTFVGVPYNGNGQIPLVYDATAHFTGWNLIGNPFATAATIDKPFYRMNPGGTALSAQVEAGNTVEAMEGVFVQATATGQSANFTAVTRRNAKAAEVLQINLSGNKGEETDNTIIRFDGGQPLGKFTLRTDDSRLYILQDGKEYAVATEGGVGTDGVHTVFTTDELPLNFKAAKNGTYTLGFAAENVEFSYLHLIDNLTGTDVDLLSEPVYTFEARTSDYASRFRLVFSANTICGDADGDNAFAFYNGSEWVVSNAGRATLQVVDVMGRVLSSETINGNAEIRIHQPAGVYMFRLISGDNVKVQKVVVK